MGVNFISIYEIISIDRYDELKDNKEWLSFNIHKNNETEAKPKSDVILGFHWSNRIYCEVDCGVYKIDKIIGYEVTHKLFSISIKLKMSDKIVNFQ